MGLGSAAADSLTSGNRNLFPGSPPPPPNPPSPPGTARHGSPLGRWDAPCKHPFPGSTPRHSTRGRRGLPMGCSHGWALLTPTQGFLHHPADVQPGWQGARSPGTQRPPSPRSPRATFARDPPGTAGAGPCGAAPASRHCLYSWEQQDPGSVGTSLPPAPPTKQAFRAGSGGCPGQTCVARVAGGIWHFPAGPGAHNAGLVVSQMPQTRCSHAAVWGCLPPGGGGQWGAPRGAQGGHSQAPSPSCPAQHPACPA